ARGPGEVDRRIHARPPSFWPHHRGRGTLSLRGDRLTDLQRTASTVIVGGGIVGVAAAFFLTERGERDVLLLERGRLGSGTTKGGLGGIRHQFVDELDVRLSQLASAFWRSFEDRTGAREDLAVESILREGDRVTGVRTREGDVSARRVLVAAGCWTSTVCATALVAVPIWPYRRSIILSGPIPRLATIPLVVEWESGFHFRPKGTAQRFAVPNITADGREEKGPANPPAVFPGDFAPLEVPST